MNYAYCVEGEELTFRCDDKKVFADICDYIERYIDAERWRNAPKQTTVYQKGKQKRY